MSAHSQTRSSRNDQTGQTLMEVLVTQNFELFDPVAFIAVLADHIPHRRRHRVSYYGAIHHRYRCVRPVPDIAPPTEEPTHLQELDGRSWAKLLWRVFEIDVLRCDECGGRYRIISVIRDEPVVLKILRHLDLPTDWPTTRRARAAPGVPPGAWEPTPCADRPGREEPVYDFDTGCLILRPGLAFCRFGADSLKARMTAWVTRWLARCRILLTNGGRRPLARTVS